MLKINGYKVEFDSNEHPNMYDTHTRNNIPNLVKLNLPIEIIDAGLWEVIFYNDRVKQRQSLSEALRARSDN